MGPKKEFEDRRGMRYHAKERISARGKSEWFFEGEDVSLRATNMLLVRITIAKVLDNQRLKGILRQIPIKQGEPGWNCVIWVKEALEALRADEKALGTGDIGWQKVRDTAMGYIQQKKDEHRFDGRANFDLDRPATYSLLEMEETIP